MVDVVELLAEAERIVQTAVHAHAPERVVDVTGVADERHAPLVVHLGNALVDRVQRAMADVVVAVLVVQVVQSLLDECIREQ